MNLVKNSHCSFCGAKFPSVVAKHAVCGACGKETWLNPGPVSIMLLPVETGRGTGILLVRRDIEPCRGGLGLPGGYLDFGETLEDGARRELKEETGVDLPAGWPLRITHSRHSRDLLVLAFCEAAPIDEALIPDPFVPNDETQELVIARAPIELCFQTHTEALKLCFERLHASDPVFR